MTAALLVVAALAAAWVLGAVGVFAFGAKRRAVVKTEAIVVAGARVVPPGVPSPALQGRIDRAARLYAEGLAPLVVCTGGSYGGLPSEAAVTATGLKAAGVPEAAIVLEPRSRTTLENAVNAAQELRERGLSKVLVVTDAFHLLRATRLFRGQGLEVQPVAAGRPLAWWREVGWSLREALAALRPIPKR